MKLINNLYLLITMLALTLLSACSDDNVTSIDSERGYIQVRILPEMITKANMVETLSEIKKVELTLRHKGMPIVQTLSMREINGAADHGLTSEKLSLNSGEYNLLSYRLLGSVILGEEKPQEIATIYPSTSTIFDIVNGHIYELELSVSSKLRGTVSFKLEKDLSNYQDEMDKVNGSTKATVQSPEDFKYSQTKEADIYYRRKGSSERPAILAVNAYTSANENFFHTDTVKLESGDYEITKYLLYTKNRTEMTLAADLTDTYFTVEPNNFSRTSLPIVYPKNMKAISDYIALYNIWKALDGENWSYSGYFLPEGCNWRFENRPIDEWGNQPGIILSAKGRVRSINIGCFNPRGDVPADIATLTDLQSLTLGINSDMGVFDFDEVVYSIDKSSLIEEGVDLAAERMEIAKEELALKYYKKNKYTLLDNNDVINTKYARAYTKKPTTKGTGIKTNGITSIPEEISQLTNLTHIYISGGFVDKLPDSFAEMTNLTDIELYNCEFKEFPEVLTRMSNIVAINFSMNESIPQDKMNEGINKFLKNAEKLQIAYFNDNNISEFPKNIVNAKNICLIDFAYNKLTELPNLERAIAPVQAYFEHNQIVSVHEKFCDTDDLETISFANNKIKEFPGLFGNGVGSASKYKIETIDFTKNELTSFHESFNGVYVGTLDLTYNKFGENGRLFPNSLADTKSKVSYLIIDNCELDTLPNSAFKNMGKHIEALQAKGNYLSAIPEVFNVEEMPYLSGLDLSINRFKSVPAQPFYIHGLYKFYIAQQFDVDKRGNHYRCLKSFVSGLNTHPGLAYLDVSGNDILKISSSDFPVSLIGFSIVDNPNIEVTVPKVACMNIGMGLMSFVYDPTQYILDCPYIELED